MIRYVTGDIFADTAEAIVNTVNCVGVMGRGIALQAKKKYPDNFKAYEKQCKLGEMVPGRMFVYEFHSLLNPKYIINFPTKRHWRGESRIEDIDSGLADLLRVMEAYKITSIAIPPLGCGLGGLDWALVKGRIDNALSVLADVDIRVYEPAGAPKAEDMVRNKKVPKMTPGRAALIGLIRRYLDGLLDPHITLLEVHKLMYFMQTAGEKLQLDYTKAAYGPFAPKLSHVLNAIEGHMLSGYADGGNNPFKRLSLVPGASEDAAEFLTDCPDTIKHMTQVSDLVDGFETAFGLELLATVHWLVQEGAHSVEQVVEQTYAWNDHKRQFDERQIGIALQRLVSQHWIDPIEGLTQTTTV